MLIEITWKDDDVIYHTWSKFKAMKYNKDENTLDLTDDDGDCYGLDLNFIQSIKFVK